MSLRYDKSTPKISWREIALACLVMVLVAIFGSAQAQTCPGPPTSTLTSVDYDPLSPVDTVKSFTMSMPAGRGYSGRVTKEMVMWKQEMGTETEGVKYDLNFAAGGNFTLRNDYGMQNMGYVGFGWRGDTNMRANLTYVSLAAGVVGTSQASVRFSNGQALTEGRRIVEFASYSYYKELLYTGACPYLYGQAAAATQSFTLNVASAMALSMAGGGTSGTIDFANTLATGAKKAVNLRLRSNTPYRVTMDSAYNGVLKLNNSPSATEQITYSTTLNGQSITEASPFINTSPTGTGNADITVPFEVTIGDTSAARAGFYKDVLTINISAQP